MLTELERSKSHLALTSALNISENPQTDTDRRKAGLALAVSRYGDEPECAFIMAAADAIKDFTCGNSATFDAADVHRGTGLPLAACEAVLMLIGAEKRSPLTWSLKGGEYTKLPQDLMSQWVKRNFPAAS